MFAELFQTPLTAPEQAAVVDPAGPKSYADIAELVQRRIESLGPARGRRVGLCMAPTAEGYAALAALERLACDVFLLDEGPIDDARLQLAARFRLAELVDPNPVRASDPATVDAPGEEEPGSGRATVTILTSGTTGTPKAATHTWETLFRPARRRDDLLGTAWLAAYRPRLYAGLQVAVQCFTCGGTLVIPDARAGAPEIVDAMARYGVQFISATPSYMRRLLLLGVEERLAKLNPRQITLGGEVADQPLLDALARRFPRARVTHIFATTELGRCFSVSDGKAGFPASLLDGPTPDGVELKVQDGNLLVRSANAMRAYDRHSGQPAGGIEQTGLGDGWFATGDVVVRTGDRYRFAGRRSDVINVGGNKVFPIEVERVIRSVDGVADVRVFGKTSSIAGQLVACDLVVEPRHDPQAVREAIRTRAAAALGPHQRPRFLNVVEAIETSAAGKVVRRSKS